MLNAVILRLQEKNICSMFVNYFMQFQNLHDAESRPCAHTSACQRQHLGLHHRIFVFEGPEACELGQRHGCMLDNRVPDQRRDPRHPHVVGVERHQPLGDGHLRMRLAQARLPPEQRAKSVLWDMSSITTPTKHCQSQ